MKSRFKLIIPILLILLVIIIGGTYAFFEYYKIGANDNQLIFGNVYLKLDDGTDTLNVSNIFPETKEEARARTDNLLTFTVAGLNTTTDNDIWYQINIVEGDDENGRVRAKTEHLVFDLIEVDAENNETLIADAFSFEELTSAKLWVDRVNRNTTTEIKRTYKLRMWLSEDVFISDTNPKADYTTDIFRNGFASVKVSVYGDFNKKISPNLNYNVENYYALTEPDSAGTRYLYGQVDNNYLWYSGKLWRIVGMNGDGSIKIVCENSVTMLAWSTSSSSTSYTSSQIRTWLNNVFLPTVYDSENLLVNYAWDYSTYSSFPNSKPSSSSTVVDKVGLLSVYDYMMTGGSEYTSFTDTFLGKNGKFWTMSTKESGSKVWFFSWYYASSSSPTSRYGIRPVVNLIPNLSLKGSGTVDDPFTLDRDISVGKANDKLNTRLSGEYINFNDTKYRIIDIENVNGVYLTKVVFSDSKFNLCNSLPVSQAFGSSITQLSFSASYGIGLYLQNWYNANSNSTTYADFYINNNYKKMIATSSDDKVAWYTGSTSTGYSYQNAFNNRVSATIGIGRYGELFSASFCGTSYIWLITKYSGSYAMKYDHTEISNSSPSSSAFVRPAFYLKSNVMIGDTDGDGNVGNGMIDSPYEIVMNS